MAGPFKNIPHSPHTLLMFAGRFNEEACAMRHFGKKIQTIIKISNNVGSSRVANAANVVAPAVQLMFAGRFNDGRILRLFAFGTSFPET